MEISCQMIWVDANTRVTRIVEYELFPQSGRFVRPGMGEYKSLFVSARSPPEGWTRAEQIAQIASEDAPQCVESSNYT